MKGRIVKLFFSVSAQNRNQPDTFWLNTGTLAFITHRVCRKNICMWQRNATDGGREHLNNELLWKIHIFSQENKIYIRNNTMFYNISFIFFVDAFIFYIFFVLYYVSNVNVNYEF